MKLRVLFALISATIYLPVAHGQSASTSLDGFWVAGCAGASAGSALFDRCQEILNAGPGSGGRRSAAAIGNNLELMAGEFDPTSARESMDSIEEESEGQWSWIGTAWGGRLERDEKAGERGFDGDSHGLLVGVGHRMSDRWDGLLFYQFARDSLDFVLDSGSRNTQSHHLGAQLSYQSSGGLFFDVSVINGRSQVRQRRRIDYELVLNAGQPSQSTLRIQGNAVARPDIESNSLSTRLGMGWSKGGWEGAYWGEAQWEDHRTAPYREIDDVGLALQIATRDERRTRIGIGAEVANAISASSGVWRPYLSLRWWREMNEEPDLMTATFASGTNGAAFLFSGDPLDRSHGELSLGVGLIRPSGWQWFAEANNSLAQDDVGQRRLGVGARKEF